MIINWLEKSATLKKYIEYHATANYESKRNLIAGTRGKFGNKANPFFWQRLEAGGGPESTVGGLKKFGVNKVVEAPVVFAGTTITPPALKRPRRETVDSSPPPARIATSSGVVTTSSSSSGNPGTSADLVCIHGSMDAPLSQSMDSVNTVATGEDEVRLPFFPILQYSPFSPCFSHRLTRFQFTTRLNNLRNLT